MSGKKPVWVDEEAHTILKKYSKIIKTSMVEVASKLVLDKLGQLDPAAGLATSEAAPSAAAPKAVAAASKTVTISRPTAAPKRKAKRQLPDPNDANIRYVGGIWLV